MPTPPDFTAGTSLAASSLNSIGLWKIGSGSLSLSTTVTNVTGVFSSTYKQYRLLLNITGRSTTNRVDMRYLVGTTSIIVGYYQSGIASDYASNTTFYLQRSNNDNRFYGTTSANEGAISIDIYNANRAIRTMHVGTIYDSSVGVGYSLAGQLVGTDLLTGFQLFTSTGTATVEYQVFGYKD